MNQLYPEFNPKRVELRLLQQSDGSTVGVISDGMRLSIVDLASKDLILDIGAVVGHPAVESASGILYISAKTGRLCKIDHCLQSSSNTLEIGGGAIDRIVASMDGNYFLVIDRENGPEIVFADFTLGTTRSYFELPSGEQVASSMFDFRKSSAFLTATADGIKVRDFKTTRVMSQLHGASGFLPLRDLRVFRRLNSIGNFLTQVVDPTGIVRLAFENRTTDPSEWKSNEAESIFAFRCVNSPLYRLQDFQMIDECGYYSQVCSNSDGSVVASLSQGTSNLYDVTSAVRFETIQLESDFSFVQFCPAGDFLVFDTRGPFSERLDWYLHKISQNN
jgi:hypothetical protein